jgi:DNA-binding MarR family transcriptional regulator
MTKNQHKPASQDASKERLRLWLRLLKSSRTIEANLRDNFRTEFATTLPRFDVMAALSRFEDGLKMSQLSDVLRVSNGNVTGIVDRLAQDGSLVRMTKRGLEEFAVQATAHETWINEMLGSVSEAEAQAISAQFEQLDAELEGDTQ